MKPIVFKPRRVVSGKSVPARLYRGRFTVFDDPRVYDVPLKTANKEHAEELLRVLVKEKEEDALGRGNLRAQREGMEKPILDVLTEFVTELEQIGRTDEYTRHVEARVKALARECDWTRMRDITAESFKTWRKNKVASPKTLNEYLNAACGLVKWFDKCNGRTGWNPLVCVEWINGKGRETFDRLTLTVEEARALLKAAPAERGLAYAMAMYTALRRGELEALRWHDVDLTAREPVVHVRAITAKNRTDAKIPLHPDVVGLLQAAKPADASAEDLVFQNGIPRACRGLRKDLAAAGIPWRNGCGGKLDFHSLRHTTCTLLSCAEVPPRFVQEVMRHSDLRLTTKIYTDASRLPIAASIRKFPSLLHSRQDSLTSGQTCQNVSGGVTCGTAEERPQRVGVALVDAACHVVAASGQIIKMVEAGGVEPPAPTNKDGPSAHVDSRQDSPPADLQEVVASWPSLPDPLKAAVLAVVRSAGRGAP